MELPQQINDCLNYIHSFKLSQPKAGIILGTGLGSLVNSIQVEKEFSYDELPHFVKSTVETHTGKLIFGKLGSTQVVCMQGRFHYYEGYTLGEITFPVRVIKALGAETLIVSNAAGAINPQFKAGDLMMITDHINLLGTNPLIGKNYEELGPRWPDMVDPYSETLRNKLSQVALDQGISLQKGVYACMSGPCLETKAEYRMLKTLGADAIGMSTVPEVIVAVHAGLKVMGISVLTDECFPDALEACDIQKIIANAMAAEPNLVKLIKAVLN
jgi:purine-nucleoside phosphorylase